MTINYDRLRSLADTLRHEIKGQDHVIDRVCSVLRRGELGIANLRRPKGSFLFVGPTGVGKTELTNAFTRTLFDGAAPFRFDMSEYQLQNSVDKLIGGDKHDQGLLGRAVGEAKAGTLLFDEVEKAHPLVLDLLLQVLEDGRITLATGTSLKFHGFYIVLTSNIGAAEATRMESAPFAAIERTVLARVGQALRPELVGRVTEKIVFNRLSFSSQREICVAMLQAELSRLAAIGYQLEASPAVVELLLRLGYHRTLGARPMRALVERCLQDAVIADILERRTGNGCLEVDVNTEGLYVK